MKTQTIKLSDIVIDAGTQQRVTINNDVVSEYAEAMRCGTKFPAITVFFNGTTYYLVDGYHRYNATKDAGGIDDILADVIDGTKREAVLYSLGVNNSHGIRLTNADKRKAVLTMLDDDEWKYWTDLAISKHCKVTQPFVSKIRKEINDTHKDIISENIKTVIISPLEPAQNLETENPEHEEFDPKEHELQEESRKELYGDFNPEDEIEVLQKEVSKLNAIIESDDRLAAAMSEISRLNALIEVIESQKRGFQSSENAAKKAANMWKNKFEKLEKKMKASGLVEF